MSTRIKSIDIVSNVLVADDIRASLEPLLADLRKKLSKAGHEPALARKGTMLLVDNLYGYVGDSAEVVHLDGADATDVALMPLSVRLLTICIVGYAGGHQLSMLQQLLTTAWETAADMGLISPAAKGH